MPETKKAEIIRHEKFTVDHSEVNDFGALVVTDKTGKEHKVSEKRAHLFDVFQPDAEVVVGISSYMNKEYIASAMPASQFQGTVAAPKAPTKASPQTPQSVSTGITGREGSIESQTSFKGFMEVAAAYITAGKDLPEKTFVGQCLKAAFKWGAERLGATAEVIVETVKETKKTG